jgi:hypothetical protein
MAFEIDYEEDLVPRIRDLIDGYSKDSILKEYLQNADDSGATELIVTFDKRKHETIIDSKFDVAKGASLLLYNDADFKENDFKSIVKISAQGKIENARSTGRFGQGFSSSFSISDHPSFVSSGRAYWFDVLRNSVSKGKNKSIQGWDLENDKTEIYKWLQTFNIENDQPGTTFRLPLRHTDTASQSDISHEVFKYQDFLKWCDEWKDNTSGLLFLRYVQRLVLQEINEGGEKIIHLELSTKNLTEIHQYNNELQEGFTSGLLNICEAWKEQDEALPLFVYKHNFLIKYFDREKNNYSDFEESWAVVNGIFRGNDNHLIDQAIKVLNISPNPRKVLPWAGVAISLDKKGYVNKNLKSNYYTFLPLPIKSKHPVHIHGWFDLNPKRTEITYDGSGDDKSILIEWNRLLFKDGVGTVWAYLINFVKENCDSQRYYSLWPKNNDDEFDEYLLEGFYQEISKLQCFKTKHKEETNWKTPKDNVYYFKYSSKDKIFDALKEHFSIITPKPSQRIIESLSDIDINLKEITPELIHNYLFELSEEIDFPIAFDDMPIEMLSNKKWFLSVLEFCAEINEKRDYSILEGLPLELTFDNKVTCIKDNRLFDKNPKLLIFENDESLFLHPDMLEIVKNADVLPSTWLKPNLKNYLTILNKYLDNYDRKNKEWLTNLVSMISEADESEISEAINELYKLEVIYQYDGTFAQLRSDKDSPVLITKDDISNINYLSRTGISLVHSEYIDSYRPLLKWNARGLITELNSYSLIKYLIYIPKNEYEFFEEKETREYLIDLIAQDISWIDKFSSKEIRRLNDMPFIASESGSVFAKSSDKKLYIPAGFKPPKHIHKLKGEYEIISIVDDNQRALYKKMGFEEQNLTNYLNQIIIPFIESLPSVDDVRNIFEWLASSWDVLSQELDKDQKDNLISILSESQIIIDGDCNLKAAKDYYHPDFFSLLPNVLQDDKYLPLKFEDETTQKKWSDLLVDFGASTKIIPEHIVTTVQSIIDDDQNSIDLLNYISNHFEWFENMKYDKKNIFDYLADLAWLPAENPISDFLNPEDKYKKLYKPSELILRKDYKIAGGAHYSLSSKVKLSKKDEKGEFTEKDIAKNLGLIIKLPNTSIFKSFRRLQIHSGQRHESNVLQFAKEIYKYLGRSHHINEDDIPDNIKTKAVFIKGEWLPSSKVFQVAINLSGISSWCDLIARDGKESHLAKGLIKLGVLEKPDNEFLMNYLDTIPQNQKLKQRELKDAKVIFGQLQDSLEDIDEDLGGIPLLTRSNQLISCEQLFLKDLSTYDKSEKKNDQLQFCQQQYEKLAKIYGAISLAENITSNVDLENSQESSEPDNYWKNYIRSYPFKTAVLRLIYHEGKHDDDQIKQESIDEVLPSNVMLMDSLVVRYFIGDTWIYDDMGAATHGDIENSTLYLLNQDDEEDICESIANYISDFSDLKRDSFSLIGRILRQKIKSVKEIHNLLDNKNIKSLPEKIEIDETFSLFSNNVEPEENLEGSTYCSSDEEQHAINDSHFLTEKVAQEISNTSKKNQKPSQSGEEIPPPTKPKKSISSNTKSEKSSSDRHKESSTNISNGINSFGGGREVLEVNSTKEIVSSNDRKPVYVGKDKEVDSNENRKQQIRATEIGNRGEQYVLDHARNHLLSESNIFEKAPKNNKGYDILEKKANGKIVRYIEVKTLTGSWSKGGVAVTVSQLEFSQVYDNWWLFVVENINTQNTTIHTFENPVQQANSFMFDHSWKQLAETSKVNMSAAPKIGEKYLISSCICEVISIEQKGKLCKVELKEIESGKEVIKKFDAATWEKC